MKDHCSHFYLGSDKGGFYRCQYCGHIRHTINIDGQMNRIPDERLQEIAHDIENIKAFGDGVKFGGDGWSLLEAELCNACLAERIENQNLVMLLKRVINQNPLNDVAVKAMKYLMERGYISIDQHLKRG